MKQRGLSNSLAPNTLPNSGSGGASSIILYCGRLGGVEWNKLIEGPLTPGSSDWSNVWLTLCTMQRRDRYLPRHEPPPETDGPMPDHKGADIDYEMV